MKIGTFCTDFEIELRKNGKKTSIHFILHYLAHNGII